MEIKPLYASYRDITAMHLELTTRCNAACPMCPRHIDNGKDINPNLVLDEITLEQFKEWFNPEFMKQMRRVYACGNYGDPVAAKDTLEIYRYMRECNENTYLCMHTNGSARTPEWWKELAKLMNGGKDGYRQDYVVFSVDGLGDANALYRRNTNFDKIYENMKAYTAAGGIARWDFIAFRHNEHQIEEARKMAQEMGFTHFNLKKTTRWQGYRQGYGYYTVKNKDGSTYDLEQPIDPQYQHENAIEFKRALGLIPQYVTNEEFNRLFPGENNKTHIHVHDPASNQMLLIKHNELGIQCRAIKGKYQTENEIFVSATGHVYPCCFLGGEIWRSNSATWNPNDTSLQMIEMSGGMDVIDLRKNDLQSIIDTPFFQRFLPLSFRKQHSMRSFQCSSCCGDEYNHLDQGELGTTARSVKKEQERKND